MILKQVEQEMINIKFLIVSIPVRGKGIKTLPL